MTRPIHWCGEVTRPCPHTDCFWHLSGSESCTLDVAERGGATPAEVASAMGITAEEEISLYRSAVRKLTMSPEDARARALARKTRSLPLAIQTRPRRCSRCLQHGHDYRTCRREAS